MKSPISFSLRRIFTGLVGAVALAGLTAAPPASAAEPTIPIIVKDNPRECRLGKTSRDRDLADAI